MPERPGRAASKDPVIGLIVDARVIELHEDHCYLSFEVPRPPSRDTAAGTDQVLRARLLQRDSWAASDPAAMVNIDRYRREGLLRVFIRGSRQISPKETIYYAHERWAQEGRNPWPELGLSDGDILVGEIVTVARREGEIQGYRIQLNQRYDVLDVDGRVVDVKQPDIEVFLPIEEVPPDERLGDPGHHPPLGLEVNDLVCVQLYRLDRPPAEPRVSLARLQSWLDSCALAVERRGHGGVSQPVSLLSLVVADAGDPVPADVVTGTPTTPGRFPVDRPPLPDGAHVVLVDDDPAILASVETLLRANGVQVDSVQAGHGKGLDNLAGEVVRLVATSESSRCLVLVDHSLPKPGLGISLMRKVQVHCEAAGIHYPRWALLSTALPCEPDDWKELRAIGMIGALARPLHLDNVAALLDAKSEGIWQWSRRQDMQFNVDDPSVDTVLSKILARYPALRFAIVLEVLSPHKLGWLACAGTPPFEPQDLDSMLEGTGLRALAQGRLNSFETDVRRNHPFRKGSIVATRWQAMGDGRDGAPQRILGVGGLDVRQVDDDWPLLLTLVGQSASLAAWRRWALNQSSFVMLGRLMSSLAHELHNDEMALHTNFEIAYQAVGANNMPWVVQALEQIEEVFHAQQSLAQLLLRGLRERDARFTMRELFAHLERVHRKLAAEEHVQLAFSAPPDITLGLPSGYVIAAVSNLIFNAIKHHHRITAARVQVSAAFWERADSCRLCIDVEDNGPGVAASVASQLFRAGVSHAADASQRHGMGLWLSRRLMRELGGDLRCMAQARGLGTVFRVELPLTMG
ncbi:ATP-binding protein [Piscinibacter terrae]|nr:ATP-binding protein [Albitalea terrae]